MSQSDPKPKPELDAFILPLFEASDAYLSHIKKVKIPAVQEKVASYLEEATQDSTTVKWTKWKN